MKRSYIAGTALILIATLASGPLLACAMAWPKGERPALMKAERTLIIWNPKKKREDFIRSIDFETTSKQLGFIVPVPSIPEVGDMPDYVFESLEEKMEGQTTQIIGAARAIPQGMPKGAVREVAKFDLKNFEVKVIQADSIKPLVAWLNTHHFALRPELKTWLEPYIDKKYYFTVFNFKKSSESTKLTQQTVRITFDTPEPYYPYRESADAVSDTRNTIIYFLSDGPYSPDFLTPGSQLSRPDGWMTTVCKSSTASVFLEDEWRPRFSNHIEGTASIVMPTIDHKFYLVEDMNEKIALNWLTVWEDHTKKRPDRDLSFVKNSEEKKFLLCPH